MIELKFTGPAHEVLAEMKHVTLAGMDPRVLQVAMQLVAQADSKAQTPPAAGGTDTKPAEPASEPAPAAQAEAPKRGRKPKAPEVREDIRMETTAPLEQLAGATNAGDDVTESKEPAKVEETVAEVSEADARVAAYRLLACCGPKTVTEVFAKLEISEPRVPNLKPEQRLAFISYCKEAIEQRLSEIDGSAKADMEKKLADAEAKARGAK